MKYNYGITGDIASGKSTLSNLLRAMGFRVIDADLVSRELMEPGKKGFRQVLAAFPEAFCHGALDRKKLGQIIFTYPSERKRLDAILHPLIVEAMFEKTDEGVNFLDAPLLFEAGMDGRLDRIIYVSVDEDIQLQRIMKRDGLTREEALDRMASFDYPREKKIKLSYLIENNGTIEELRQKLVVFLEEENLL